LEDSSESDCRFSKVSMIPSYLVSVILIEHHKHNERCSYNQKIFRFFFYEDKNKFQELIFYSVTAKNPQKTRTATSLDPDLLHPLHALGYTMNTSHEHSSIW
jgi:hypothetical protein